MKITMMMAVTLDGKIAKNSKHFPDWTSPEDKKLFKKISQKHGVVIMGDKTFFTLPDPLADRLNVVFTLKKNPPKIKDVKWVSGDPRKVLQKLKRAGYKSALLAGGANLNSLFLRQNLISEIIVTIEPKIFGRGLSLFNGDFNINLRLSELKQLNKNTIMLRYKVRDEKNLIYQR